MPKKFFSPKFIKFLAIIGICLVLIFLDLKGFFSPVRNFFITIAYPFQKTFFILSRSTSQTFKFLGSISELRQENERLLKENYSLSGELSFLKEQKKENETLRQQLNLDLRKKFDLEASFVIGQDSQRLGSWIMIDKGSSSGIKSGMPVIAFENILIGKVEEVNFKSSKINLLSYSESAVNAFDSETGAKGIIKGEYNLGIVMDMISQEEAVNSGDTVMTSGLGSDMPKGLLIGRVQEVKSSEDNLFQKAIITPGVKYSKIDIVFVVKN